MRHLLICVMCLAVICMCCAPLHAYADDDSVPWIRIIDEYTPLYANANTANITCILELGYYLYIVDTVGDYYLVQLMDNSDNFPQILGYVQCQSVQLCTELPVTPYYPHVYATVSSSSTVVRLSPLDSANTLITATNTQSMSYYGYVNSADHIWYYVYFCGVLGYVDSTYVALDDIPAHPTPLYQEEVQDTLSPTTPEDSTDNSTTTDMPTSSTSEILLILFVVALSVALVLALFLPRKAQRTTSQQIWDKHL